MSSSSSSSAAINHDGSAPGFPTTSAALPIYISHAQATSANIKQEPGLNVMGNGNNLQTIGVVNNQQHQQQQQQFGQQQIHFTHFAPQIQQHPSFIVPLTLHPNFQATLQQQQQQQNSATGYIQQQQHQQHQQQNLDAQQVGQHHLFDQTQRRITSPALSLADSNQMDGSVRGRSNTRGRRSANGRDDPVTVEEEERRRLRRERNKAAAARCRKRRMDQIQILSEESEQLENDQLRLASKVSGLERQLTELQRVLESHRRVCRKDLTAASGQSAAAASDSKPVDNNTVQSTPNQPLTISTTGTGADDQRPASSRPLEDCLPTAPIKKLRTGDIRRPASLPVKAPINDLCLPTPSPSKLVFSFDHSGLTPTGLTPTGLTPMIPNSASSESAAGQSSTDEPSGLPTSDAASSSLSLVSL